MLIEVIFFSLGRFFNFSSIDLTGVASDGTTNFRKQYKSWIQTNAQDITDPSNLEFPGSFDSYLGTFNAYYNGDLCASYYKSISTSQYTGKTKENP